MVPTATLAYTTDYVHRGLTQSSGEGAIQAGAGLRFSPGVYANVWGSTIDTDRLGPDFGDGSGYELDILLGLSRPLSAHWRWDVNVGRYLYLEDRRNLDYHYTEYAAAIAFRERLRLSLAWSPKVTDHTRRPVPQALSGPRMVYELSGEWPLTRWIGLAGGGGYNDSREVSDLSYWYWSAGVNLRWRRYALGLRHYSTDSDARERWSDGRAADRFAADLVLSFG